MSFRIVARGLWMEIRSPQPTIRNEIVLVDRRVVLRRPRLVGDFVEFDDSPAAEIDRAQGGEDAVQIDLALPQLDEAIPGRTGPGRNVLDMQEQQPLRVPMNGAHGIAAALLVVR